MSNPSSPQLRGSYATPGYALDVAVSSGLAYVADDWDGLQIIDVSHPSSPTLRGSYDTRGDARALVVSGGLAYVADGCGLRIIDVSNPSSPQRRGAYDTLGYVEGVAVSGGLAYVADYQSGLQIIDVSNPASPQRRGAYDTPGYAVGVYVTGGIAYVADDYGGLQIIDVSNPWWPQILGWYVTPDLAYGVAVSGSLAYVADNEAGLQIIDVSNPSSPRRRGWYDTPGWAMGVAVSGGLAYVADYDKGLQIIDVSNPSSPQWRGSYNTPDFAEGVAVSGGLAYVAAGGAGLWIFQYTPGTVPAAPSNLAATAVSQSQINLSWNDNSTNEQGSKIERKTGPGGTWLQIATVGANVTSYQNTGLQANTTYYYRVRAYNVAGDSGYSNEARAATLPNPPVAPSNLTATAISGRQINLSWRDNSTNEAGFKIQRKTGTAGTWSQIAAVGPNVRTYQNAGLAAVTAYYYRVCAYNAGGDSNWSNVASAMTPTGVKTWPLYR